MRYNLWIIFFLEKNLTWVKLYKKEYKFSVNYFCAIQFLFWNVVLISVIKFNSSLPFRLYIYVMLLLPPLSYDSAIKKRKWYIYFLINYDNNWLPVNTVHANCLVRLRANKTNLNIFNVGKTIKCCSEVTLCFLDFEITNIIFRKVSD